MLSSWQLQSFHHLNYPFRWMPKTQKRGAQTRARTRGAGNKQQERAQPLRQLSARLNRASWKWAGVRLRRCQSVDARNRGTVERLLVAGQTDVNLSSEDGAPQKRTISEGRKDARWHKPTSLSREKSGGHLHIANLPADLRPDLRSYQLKNGLIVSLRIFFSSLIWNWLKHRSRGYRRTQQVEIMLTFCSCFVPPQKKKKPFFSL